MDELRRGPELEAIFKSAPPEERGQDEPWLEYMLLLADCIPAKKRAVKITCNDKEKLIYTVQFFTTPDNFMPPVPANPTSGQTEDASSS